MKLCSFRKVQFTVFVISNSYLTAQALFLNLFRACKTASSKGKDDIFRMLYVITGAFTAHVTWHFRSCRLLWDLNLNDLNSGISVFSEACKEQDGSVRPVGNVHHLFCCKKGWELLNNTIMLVCCQTQSERKYQTTSCFQSERVHYLRSCELWIGIIISWGLMMFPKLFQTTRPKRYSF